MDQPTAEEALLQLEPLIGEWTLEAKWPGGEPWPGGGRATFEWHASGAYLIQSATADLPEAPDNLSIIGCDAANGTYFQLYSDERGVSHVYQMSIGNGQWKLWREGEPFSQRFTAIISDDGNTLAGRWEIAEDGANYRTDFDLIYRRIPKSDSLLEPGDTSRAGAIPDGYHAVTPFVIVKGAVQFIDFMKEAFDGVEIGRVGEEGAIGHAEVRIGDSVVMLFDSQQDWPETPAFLRLYVEDCDSTYRQALASGASLVTKPTNMPWGDRVARVRDPFGNLWWIMTRLEELSEEEIAKRYGEKEYVDAMQYVQGADFFGSTADEP